MKIKDLKQFFIRNKTSEKEIFTIEKERELLEKKVLKGTDFAVREYGEVFKKLAEYDKTLN